MHVLNVATCTQKIISPTHNTYLQAVAIGGVTHILELIETHSFIVARCGNILDAKTSLHFQPVKQY